MGSAGVFPVSAAERQEATGLASELPSNDEIFRAPALAGTRLATSSRAEVSLTCSDIGTTTGTCTTCAGWRTLA